jgi:DNA polymerase-3 subunit beta
MKIEINSKQLSSVLDNLRSVVERRTTIPALANVLIESVDGKLRFTATDLDNTLQIEIDAEHEGENLCVSLERLHGLVKALPEQDITIKKLDNAWAEILTETGKFKIQGIEKEKFPSVDNAEGMSYECEGEDFIAGLSRVVQRMAREEDSRWEMRAVLMEVNGCLRFVATTGKQMSVCDVAPGQPFLKGDKPFFSESVPQKTVRALLNVFNTEEGIIYLSTENHLQFRQGNKKLTARKLTGKFPAYEMILSGMPSQRIVVDKSELSQTLKTFCAFKDASYEGLKSAQFKFEKNNLAVSALTSEASGISPSSSLSRNPKT